MLMRSSVDADGVVTTTFSVYLTSLCGCHPTIVTVVYCYSEVAPSYTAVSKV